MRTHIVSGFIIILLALALVGCAKQAPPPAQPTATAQPAVAPTSTPVPPAATEMDQGVKDIDTLNQDMNTGELDSLDKDLSGVNW